MSLGMILNWRARLLRLELAIPWESPVRRPCLSLRPHFRPAPLTARLSQATANGSAERKYGPSQAGDSIEPSQISLSEVVETSPAAPQTGANTRHQPKTNKQSRKKGFSRYNVNLAKSVLVKPAKVYPHPSQTRKSETEHHRSVVQQERLERQRLLHGSDEIHWAETLDLLSQITPVQPSEWIEDGLRLDLSEEAMKRLLEAGGDDKIGALRSRSGAGIKVSRNEPALLLSGNEADLHAAVEEVRRIADSMTVTRLSSPTRPKHETVAPSVDEPEPFFTPPLSPEEGGWVRRTWIYDAVSKAVPAPKIWTARTFEEYIAAIVSSQTAPHLAYRVYMRSREKNHDNAVVNLLHDIFDAAPLAMVSSCSAFKVALSFMCRRGAVYLPQVRKFVNLMNRRGLRMDTKVFNILLSAVVKTKDLLKFHQTVSRMKIQKITPNLETYLLFMRLFEAIQVKIQILKVIYSKNLHIGPSASQAVAAALAPYEAESAILNGKSITTFMTEQDARYGRNWLTAGSGNLVLNALCRHGRLESAWQLLDIMYERGGGNSKLLDVASFNHIITYARSINKVPLAINTMRKMHASGIHPDRITLHLLFEIAWHARLRTTIVVVWRYACLARLTTWRMRRRVFDLLFSDQSHRDVLRKVGGHALLRELLGGHAHALRRHGATDSTVSDQTGMSSHTQDTTATPLRLSILLATKTLPIAFEEFAPTVPLSEVLVQSVMVDFHCLRARKEGRLKEELASAAVKVMRLWRRMIPMEQFWPSLVEVSSSADPRSIGMADRWKADAWTSEGWSGKYAFGGGRTSRKQRMVAYNRGLAIARYWRIFAKRDSRRRRAPVSADTSETLRKNGWDTGFWKQQLRENHTKLMAIINPRVWDDTLPLDKVDPLRTPVQLQNQKAILQALRLVVGDRSGKIVPRTKRAACGHWVPKRLLLKAERKRKYENFQDQAVQQQSGSLELVCVPSSQPEVAEEHDVSQRHEADSYGLVKDDVY